MWTQIAIISIGLTLVGALYGFLIAKHPLDRTWVEVLFGVGGTLCGEVAIRWVVNQAYPLGDQPDWAYLITLWCFGLTGVWQIVFQERKRNSQEKRTAERQAEIYKKNGGFDA